MIGQPNLAKTPKYHFAAFLKPTRMVLKKNYLGSHYGRYYRTQTEQALEQAIGRGVRHKDDYCCILLCDYRYNFLD